MQLQQHHFGSAGTGTTNSNSSSSSSSSGKATKNYHHPLDYTCMPSTSAGPSTSTSQLSNNHHPHFHQPQSTTSTPLAQTRSSANPSSMYRLSSFRPNSLGGLNSGEQMNSPPGTPLTESGPSGLASSSTATTFLRQSSVTGSVGGGGGQSPPSSLTNVPTYETIDVNNLR